MLRSRQSGLSVSELARQAVREKYLSPAVQRKDTTRARAGIRKDRPDLGDPETRIRGLPEMRRLCCARP